MTGPPEFVGTFSVPEVEVGTGISSMVFGSAATFGPSARDGYLKGTALFAKQGSGLVFYEFSDPIAPTPVTETFQPKVTVAQDLQYLAGVFAGQTYPAAVYYRNAIWYVAITADGETGEIWAVHLKQN